MSIIGTAIIAATFGLSFDAKGISESIDESIDGKKLVPIEVRIDPKTLTGIPDGEITGKLRNPNPVHLMKKNNQVLACGTGIDCYVADVRRHSGVLYACKPDSINCYEVK